MRPVARSRRCRSASRLRSFRDHSLRVGYDPKRVMISKAFGVAWRGDAGLMLRWARLRKTAHIAAVGVVLLFGLYEFARRCRNHGTSTPRRRADHRLLACREHANLRVRPATLQTQKASRSKRATFVFTFHVGGDSSLRARSCSPATISAIRRTRALPVKISIGTNRSPCSTLDRMSGSAGTAIVRSES